jgi:spore germination cell wall hydrolase CwlJ-like protein
MTSFNKKFFKFLSIFTVLVYSLYGINSYAEDAIERDTREYSLGFVEVIQEIKEDAAEEKKKTALRKIETQNIHLANNRELKCLADNIYYEAGNQSTQGKLAVAAVTINRVKSPKFPKSVCAVVYQRTKRVCQFSWVCEGNKRVRSAQQYSESKKVAEKVLLSGANHGILGRNVLFYHADYVNPRWNLRRVAKIGDHIFYAG